MVKCKKALFFLSALITVFGANQAQATVTDKDNKFVRYIDEITHRGIEIKEPGIYRFQKNVTVHFRQDDIPAIYINSDNVVIDLNEYVLSQESDTENNVGIAIAPDVWGVTIKNGTIDNFSGFGIVAGPWTWALQFKDLFITDNGWDGGYELPDEIDHVGGILLDGSDDPIWDVTIDNCKILWCGSDDEDVAVNGLVAYGLMKTVIKNSSFCDNWVTSNFSNVAAEFFRTYDITIENCHFDNIWTDTDEDMEYSHAYGVLFNATDEDIDDLYDDEDNDDDDSSLNGNIKIINCTANSISGDVTELGGFSFYHSRNIVVENCESMGNYNYLNDFEGDVEFTAAAGFQFFVCDNFNVNNCRAYEQRTDDSTIRTVAGFDVAASCFGVFSNCHAAFCDNDNGPGITGGFVVEPFITREDFERNIGIVFENCISEYNVGGFGEAYPSGGFVFARGEEGKIINCEAIHNFPYGIIVGLNNGEGSNDTISSIIKDNIAFSNAFGIVDITGNNGDEENSNSLVNAYLGNVARSNGENPQSDNYDLPDGNNIVGWLLSEGDIAGSNMPTDNISIY